MVINFDKLKHYAALIGGVGSLLTAVALAANGDLPGAGKMVLTALAAFGLNRKPGS